MNNDLISRSALKEAIEEVQYTQEFCIEHQIDYSVSMQMLGMVIDNAPTVEITDYDTGYQDGLEDGLNDIRPQGEWIVDEDAFSKDFRKCSNCNEDAEWLEGGCQFLPNFCPNCGADMRGKENE